MAVPIVLLLLFSVPAVFSHAHVFINSRVVFLFEDEDLKGLRVEWLFDKFFSAMIINDYDRDKNGRFSIQEVREVEAGGFSNLRNFEYFVTLWINGRQKHVTTVTQFNAEIRNGRLFYTFTVPFMMKALASKQEVRMRLYDDTYYVAFEAVTPEDVEARGGAPSVERTITVEGAKAKPLYAGQYMPDEIVLRFGIKK